MGARGKARWAGLLGRSYAEFASLVVALLLAPDASATQRESAISTAHGWPIGRDCETLGGLAT